jgi:hypothetical protein
MPSRKKVYTIEFDNLANLKTHISESKFQLYENVIDSIDYAVKNKKDIAKPISIK